MKSRCIGAEKSEVLVGMCKTRWSECNMSYEHFYLAIPFRVEAFEIMNGTHPKNNDFDSVQYLNAITKFEFMIGLVSLYQLLHPLVGITQNLQGRSIDVIKAYIEVESCIQDMQHMRQIIDEGFHKVYKQAERLAEKLRARSTVRQMHRNNVPAENPEEYYRRALAIPLADRFIT